MPAVERTDSNHRRYSERDVAWIAFIKRLKATNMPLGEIQRYAELREQGEGAEEARMQLLSAHARRLEQTIALEQEHLEQLKEKIRCYRQLICRQLIFLAPRHFEWNLPGNGWPNGQRL